MQSVSYIPNTFEDKMIHSLVDRKAMEKAAMLKLTPREVAVIQMKYYESMKNTEIAQTLGVSRKWVYAIEQSALRKLKHIILRQRTNVVDSKTGMRENDWENLASSIASWLECQSTNTAFLRERHGVLSQWAKNIIMWRLTSDERQILLWDCNIILYPGKKNQDFYDAADAIYKKILGLLLEDNFVVEKAGYKQRV